MGLWVFPKHFHVWEHLAHCLYLWTISWLYIILLGYIFVPSTLCSYCPATPWHTQRCIIFTLPKTKEKERILKAARGKERVTYKGVPIRLSADFWKEILQARRGWKEAFEVMKGKDLHPRLLYPAKLSFRMEGQIKCFPDKVNLKEFIITTLLLYEMLKGLI